MVKVHCVSVNWSVIYDMPKEGKDLRGEIARNSYLLSQLSVVEKKDFLSVKFTFSILGENFVFPRTSLFALVFLETRDVFVFFIFMNSIQKVNFT